MNRRVWSVGVVVVLSTAALAAQGAPNLIGTWTVDRDKTAAANPPPAGGGARRGGSMSVGGVGAVGGGGAAPPQWVITQTAAALTIVRQLPDGSAQKFVYALDGTESVNVNGRTTQKTKSTVAGGKILTTGTQIISTDSGEVTSQLKETRWLEKDGAMFVETTRTVEGTGSRTTTQVFAKAK